MTRLIARIIRIRWQGFGHTQHWLRGPALIDFLFREGLMPSIADSFTRPNILITLTEGRP